MSQSIVKNILTPQHAVGLGGGPIGTAFQDISDEQAHGILQKAWDLGIRYYDTSPWYGLTKSEHRFGKFLKTQKREDFVFSTKVGRLFTKVPASKVPPTMWKSPLHFDFEHDYTADGTMRSIEESLKRTGLNYIDIVFVHDLSEDQVGDRYAYFMKQAEKGAFKVLSKLRNQGVIKAWGMGVNKIEPILECMKVADPNICLSATQYSLLEHQNAVDFLLPEVRKNKVQLVAGAGYNSGFIAGRKRYNYKEMVPKKITEKRDQMKKIATRHKVDLVHAALQFVMAANEFVSIIPGASKPQQVADNVKAWKAVIPPAFWKELIKEGLIYEKAQVPE